MIEPRLASAGGYSLIWGKPVDIDYDGNGDIITVTGKLLLDQALIKAFLTKYGASEINPGYGAALSLRGMKMDVAMSGALVHTEVTRVVSYIQNLFSQNANAEPSETISNLDNILLQPVQGDPTKIVATVLISTNDKDSSELQVPVEMV